MVYVECTGRMHAVFNVVRAVCASSVRILGKSPHFIWQRLGRSAGYPEVLDALCTPELRYSLFASRPFEVFGMARMKVEKTRCGVRVHICDDVRLQCSCRGLYRILLGLGLPERCWCLVWACLTISPPIVSVAWLLRVRMYAVSTRIRMLNDLGVWNVPEFDVWADGAMRSGKWMNDPRILR